MPFDANLIFLRGTISIQRAHTCEIVRVAHCTMYTMYTNIYSKLQYIILLKLRAWMLSSHQFMAYLPRIQNVSNSISGNKKNVLFRLRKIGCYQLCAPMVQTLIKRSKRSFKCLAVRHKFQFCEHFECCVENIAAIFQFCFESVGWTNEKSVQCWLKFANHMVQTVESTQTNFFITTKLHRKNQLSYRFDFQQ